MSILVTVPKMLQSTEVSGQEAVLTRPAVQWLFKAQHALENTLATVPSSRYYPNRCHSKFFLSTFTEVPHLRKCKRWCWHRSTSVYPAPWCPTGHKKCFTTGSSDWADSKLLKVDDWCYYLRLRLIYLPSTTFQVGCHHHSHFFWPPSGNDSRSLVCAQDRGKIPLVISKSCFPQLCSISITYSYHTTQSHTHTHTPHRSINCLGSSANHVSFP